MNTVGYTKLASSILTSTIWVESDQTLRVWIAILALCDRRGFVSGTVPGLANVAKVTVEDCRAAIAKFMGPDHDSRTQAFQGRRLKAADGGWVVLNFLKYRETRDPIARLEQTRRAVRKHREAKKADVSQCKPEKAKAEAEAEAEAGGGGGYVRGRRPPPPPGKVARKGFVKPEANAVLDYAKEIGLGPLEAERFFDRNESIGWRVGRNPMKDWRAALRTWKGNAVKWEKEKSPQSRPGEGKLPGGAAYVARLKIVGNES